MTKNNYRWAILTDLGLKSDVVRSRSRRKKGKKEVMCICNTPLSRMTSAYSPTALTPFKAN